MRPLPCLAVLLALCLLVAGCRAGEVDGLARDGMAGDGVAGDGVAAPSAPPALAPDVEGADPGSAEGAGAEPTPTPEEPAAPPHTGRPSWLGTRPLAIGPSGFPPPQPTPPDLDDRRLPPPPSELPPPADETFAASVEPVGEEVLARSTWHAGCPVASEDLRYLTVTFWGFDERHHTGELLVHADVADDVVAVLRRLHEERFPIEEMRVIRAEELDLEPTGDGNVTTAFVCRDSRGSTSWSQHAYGLAVDVNPFHNPYLKGAASSGEALATDGAVVLPELATSYVDRDRHRPGMIQPGDVVTRAFAEIGWGWGGGWSSPKDWMHFSRSGR